MFCHLSYFLPFDVLVIFFYHLTAPSCFGFCVLLIAAQYVLHVEEHSYSLVHVEIAHSFSINNAFFMSIL
jgi:hypothetical protein